MRTADPLAKIVQGVDETAASIAKIARATQEQSDSASEVSKAIQDVSSITETSASSSEDVLFHSAARIYGGSVAGIIMTGMGLDGVLGCKAILNAGGMTYGQDEDSSAVYGRNKAAYQEGAVSYQFSLDQFPFLINRLSPPSA